MEELSELLLQRRRKVNALWESGINPYPNDFKPHHTSEDLVSACGNKETITENPEDVYTVAGRIMARRSFGKAAFIQVQDRKGRVQVYVRKDTLGEDNFGYFETFDIGDIVGVTGHPFRTKTGELSLHAHEVRLLTKSLLPLPEKFHGLTDVETRYRQRYVDLIVNPEVKDVFVKRARIIQLIREFMLGHDFLEVETPMMQPIPGGATARPFETYHNALERKLYLRIAPELYLKRLLVGGFDKVFEINRNFRNEGISVRHNPEFTMMEFYMAYADYRDLMRLTEDMVSRMASDVLGSMKITYQGLEIDFTPPWKSFTMREAITSVGGVTSDIIDSKDKALAFCRTTLGAEVDGSESLGDLQTLIFEETCESKLIQPTFITAYPIEVSPLSRRNSDDPTIVDRFELYIAGREIANAFSELNDPVDQRERFLLQLKEREAGDEEVPDMDEDYVTALEYGMPPTAGEGIGIDRLVMLLTDSASIRDVILFPQMRPREG